MKKRHPAVIVGISTIIILLFVILLVNFGIVQNKTNVNDLLEDDIGIPNIAVPVANIQDAPLDTSNYNANPNTDDTDNNDSDYIIESIQEPMNWRDIELVDVLTNKTFKISDFKGKAVYLESFAVWCPTCKRQQDQVKQMLLIDDAVIHISLDTDPNEDAKKVREHAQRYGYDWYFAVSPIEMTKGLMDEFGLTVVNAPAAPMVLICEDQSARLLRNGVKSSSDLGDELSKGC